MQKNLGFVVERRPPTSYRGDVRILPNSGLYDRDFHLWLADQIEVLKTKNFKLLDIENLIEELESMAKRDRRELESRLEVLVWHLLKCQYQSSAKSNSWLATLVEQRSRISRLLKDIPSLVGDVESFTREIYPAAVKGAAAETGLLENIFPNELPYSIEQIMDMNFIP